MKFMYWEFKGKIGDGGKTWEQWNGTDKAATGSMAIIMPCGLMKKIRNRMILGNDGGVSTTYNGGKMWKNFFDKIPTTQFYTVSYDMKTPFNVFGSMQDEGTMSGSSLIHLEVHQDKTIRHWMMAPGGEGTQIQVDPKNPDIVFSSTYYGRLMKSDMSKPDSLRRKRYQDV